MIWKTRKSTVTFDSKARVMGILNVTPDSFSDGGQWLDPTKALKHARVMINDGAEIIDIGGESTRPGAPKISAIEEESRILPVLKALRNEWSGLISIDTSKASVAKAALDEGADIINDVTGLLGDSEMPKLCAATGCGVIVMHMQGTPETMQLAPSYESIIAEITSFFYQRIKHLTSVGIDSRSICLDPGIGFGKSLAHNTEILNHLGELTSLGHPVLIGLSRKSMIRGLLEESNIENLDWPTVGLTSFAREKGVLLHRVHSIKPAVEALRMTEAIIG